MGTIHISLASNKHANIVVVFRRYNSYLISKTKIIVKSTLTNQLNQNQCKNCTCNNLKIRTIYK